MYIVWLRGDNMCISVCISVNACTSFETTGRWVKIHRCMEKMVSQYCSLKIDSRRSAQKLYGVAFSRLPFRVIVRAPHRF